jgi:uncharacterized protein
MDAEIYLDEVRAWRQAYTEKLLSRDGWLSISGLFWLQQGENSFGTDPGNHIILPPNSGPATGGTFRLHDRHITLQTASGVQVIIKDQPVTSAEITINSYGSSEWIYLNDLRISIIERGIRFGARVYDRNHPALKQSVSLRWFPIQDAYCIQARFVPFDEPQKLSIVNVIGDTLEIESPGYAEFDFQGNVCRMRAIPSETTDGLWFIFQDGTSRDVTFPGGRYLITDDLPQDGLITLDFNKAHNPPCAYTDFATCPLAPKINHLPVPIKAGELKFPKPIVSWS